MDFPGPEDSDLDNVRELNRAFLGSVTHLDAADSSIASAGLAALDAGRRQHVAACPFLLFDIGDYRDPLWERLFDPTPQRELDDMLRPGPTGSEALVGATLGFLWTLARRNAFAARLVSGATIAWCEALAACELMRVFEFGRDSVPGPRPRREDDARLWGKLLSGGTSGERSVREAAHVSALQTLLTTADMAMHPPVAAAACRIDVPAKRLAE